MKLTINQFLSRFPSEIKTRGKEFYDNDDYANPVLDENHFECDIRGIHGVYRTIFQLDDRQIEGYSCDCPYFQGGHLCKHLYAAGLLMKKMLAAKSKSPSSDIVKNYKFQINNGLLSKSNLKNFLTPVIQSQDKETILMLCKLTNRKNLATYFFELIYQSELREWFFSSVCKENIGTSVPTAILDFFQEHDDLFPLMNLNLSQLLITEVNQKPDFALGMFERAILLKDKEKIKLFSEKSSYFTFQIDQMLFHYLEENEKPEHYSSYFDERIKTGRLFKYEYAFLYPYLSDEEKSTYLEKRNENTKYCRSFFYFNREDYCPDADYSNFVYASEYSDSFLRKKPDAPVSSLCLTDFGAFRKTIFKDYGKEAFKRFKNLFGGFLRRKEVTAYQIHSVCLIFEDCLQYNEELRPLLDKFIDKYRDCSDLNDECKAHLFSLMKKEGKLSKKCIFVDYQNGTDGYDAMDVVKTEERKSWY